LKKYIMVGVLLTGAAEGKTLYRGVVNMTSYSSTVGQTDSTPFITATGTRVRTGVVAVSRNLTRYYGKNLKIIETYGSGCGANSILPMSRKYKIEDTMNSRFFNKIDIWVPSIRDARTIGKCTALIQITD
jgi:3D (Asp-Asp-Asp) domain-containing protein